MAINISNEFRYIEAEIYYYEAFCLQQAENKAQCEELIKKGLQSLETNQVLALAPRIKLETL